MAREALNNPYLLENFVQQASIHAGAGTLFKVVWEETCKEPTFDGKKITLPALGPGCSRADVEQQRAFVNRCTAYGRWGEGKRTPILKTKNPNNTLTRLFHQADDSRCEKLESEEYRGVYDNLVNTEDQSLKTLFKQLTTLDDSVFNDEKASRELAHMAGITLAHSAWNPASRDYLEMMGKLYQGSKTGAFIEKMFDENLPDEFYDAETAKDSYDAALKMYKILYEDSEGEGEGTGDHNKPKNGTSADGLAKGEGQGDGEGEGYGDGMSEKDKATMKRLLTEYKNYDYTPGGSPNPVVITYEGRGDGLSKPMEPYSKVPVVDLRKQKWAPGSRGCGVDSLKPSSASGNIDLHSAAFANKVRNLLQIKAQAYYTHGHKKGTLSTKRLYRMGMPIVGDGSWNSKIYKKRHIDRILDCAVSVMIDVSGSMYCVKTFWTYKGCVLLNHVFSKVLHVPLEIACFNTDDKTRIGLFKGFNQTLSNTQIKSMFDDVTGHMTGNNDSTALLWAASRLVTRREPRKILIMMSDGQPSAGGHGDCDYQLRCAAKTVEARRDVELFSIGIEYNGVKNFYKNWSEVKTGEDIEESLIKVLGKALINVA